MIFPSSIGWPIGVAVVIFLSVLLRHLANDAYRVAISRRVVPVPLDPKGKPILKKAAQRSELVVRSAVI